MTPSSARAGRPARSAAVIAAGLLAAVCAPPRAPETRPSPPTPEPPPPIVQRIDARGYTPRAGTLTYEVTSETTIDVRGDTLAADTLAVAARLTYRVGAATPADTGTAAFRVGGSVDAYEVRTSRPGLASPDTLPLPMPFVGALGPSGIVLEGIEREGVGAAPAADTVAAGDTAAQGSASPSDSLALERPCVAALSAPIALARELLLLPPSSLALGATWSDTTVTTICRGGVPVTTTVAQRFTILGSTRVDGDEAVAIERTSTSTIAGTVRLRGRVVTVSGTGEGRSTIYASVARGAILGADGVHESELAIESGTRRQQFVQATRQRVRLRSQH